jgi:hypothetical protein
MGMASKRHQRRKACEWKRSHPTQAEAVSASLSLRRHTGERTRAYRCPFCGLWHHGHTARRTKKVMRVKRGY